MTETVGLVQQFVERTGQLYSLPAVAAEVVRLTGEPRLDARALRDCLQRDPALTARLLRVVNSSLFGLSRPVSDLNQALALLGIRPLKMLVLGFSLPKDLFSGVEASVLARYWRRTLVKAVAARELAERLWRVAGDEAFIAGLVQDIGVLALIQQLGESYQKFLDHVQTHGGGLLSRETETLGFDHLVLSGRLLSHWGLPPSFCAALAVPPNEARIAALDETQRTLPQILHMADVLVRLIEQPYSSALSELLDVGGRYCDLTYEKLQALMALLQPKVEELADVLSLELPETNFGDLLIAAQRQLADEAAVAAIEIAAPEAEEELLELASQLRGDLALALGRPQGGNLLRELPTPPHDPARTPIIGSKACNTHQEPICPLAERADHFAARGCVPPESVDSTFVSRVGAAIQRCRVLRRPVTLALFEIERFSEALFQLTPAGVSELSHWLGIALAEWTGHRGAPIMVRDGCFAFAWEDCSRSEGLRLARAALGEVKPWSSGRLPGQPALILSSGLATLEAPPKNYPPQDLIDAAQRCLQGAELSGGDTVKSIAV
jgi:HD-like signal output (HDOD) protein